MNLTEDDVVNKLVNLSIETKELIENCEKASEETKIFKVKSEILEEEVRRVSEENEALKKENELLRNKLCKDVPSEKYWVSVVENANQVLCNTTPRIVQILEKLDTSEHTRIRLEKELIALKEENSNLLIKIEEKDAFASRQSSDFLNLKEMVDRYQSEISRLDSELQNCQLRVSTLNEHLEVINAENLDLAEYTNFKSFLKKSGSKEDVNEVITKLQTVHEIEELCNKKLSPHIEKLSGYQTMDNLLDVKSHNGVNKVKYCFEKALLIIEKLNESNISLDTGYKSTVRTKNDTTVKANEPVEGNSNQLTVASKAQHRSFEKLRCLYGHSRLFNDQLFAKFSQLRLWFRILKIRILKLSSQCNIEAGTASLPPLSDFFYLMEELFGNVAKKKLDFDQRVLDLSRMFANYEADLDVNDYLKNTVDDMTLEVKRLTSQVEQQMNRNILEIESLKGEMDSVKADNCQLVNKIKNCNQEIISLSTENYELNEKLSIFSQIENDYETLKNELLLVKNKLGRYENERDVVTKNADKFIQLHDICVKLQQQTMHLKEDVSGYRSSCNDLLQQTIQLVSSIGTFQSGLIKSDMNAQNCEIVDLTTLQTKCSEFKNENQNLKVAVKCIRQQMHDEISFLKKNLQDALISSTCQNVNHTDFVSLLKHCRDLKQHNKLIGDTDFFSPIKNTVETARATLLNKLENVAKDLNRLQTDLNTTIDDKNLYKELVSVHLLKILEITKDLKSSLKLVSSSITMSLQDFTGFNEIIRQKIQEAITHTIEHVKSSTALSNEEVIKEMQEVNSELKKRSETIFVLNQRADELVKENDRLSRLLTEQEKLTKDLNDQLSNQLSIVVEKQSQINSINANLADLTHRSSNEIEKKNVEMADLTQTLEKTKALLRSKEDLIQTLEGEISKIKDIQAADGDVSSMGNISRTEEVSRLRDVEDSFEERYMKLRCIAVKMKKNIADLNQQLLNEKSERNAIQCKLNIATEQAKRNQILQEECDRINDELELKVKEIKELKKIIIEADKKNETNESLAKEFETLAAQKTEVEIEKKNLISFVEELKKEKFAQETLKKEMEKEVQQLKQKLKENAESMKKVQSDLEYANLEVRKRGTLTLEMRDYEKTISELADKLKEKNSTIDKLNETIKINAESNQSLIERVKGLEGQISSFGAASKLADEQILNLNRIISTHEKDSEMRDNLLKQSKEQLEEERSKNEVLRLQLTESVVNANDSKERLRNVQESLNNQLKLAQNSIKNLQEQLTKKESQFDKLKEDFETYKIRAHNVLQKHKNENNLKNNEEKLKMKIDDLSQTVKELRKRLDDTLMDLDNNKAELKVLQDFKEKSLGKMKDVQKVCAEKSKELDSINAEFKLYKLNNETLIKCYQNEIENLRVSYQKLDLKLQDSKPPNEQDTCVKDTNNIAGQVEELSDQTSTEKLDSRIHTENNLPSSNTVNLVRVKNQNHELVPLEKLLKSDFVDEQRASDDVAELRKNVEKLENQVTYLNGILNESEKNAARSEQTVAWLKDINKRLQKTIDRAPHLQNGEYLKNVLFNFFTFPDGEEKCKLITILETLLQLTPEEKGILSAIAKGERSEQKRSSGFTSFLRFG